VKPPEPPSPAGDATESPSSGISKAGAELKTKLPKPHAQHAPHAHYQRPHQAHVYRHVRVAGLRAQLRELEEEARRHHIFTQEGGADAKNPLATERHDRIEGLNFDERRKKKGKKQKDHDREHRDDQRDQDEGTEAQASKARATSDGRGKYFQDQPADRLGDLTLTDPDEVKRLLGPSVRFAQHTMLLAEARLKQGVPREEAIAYLAELYVGLSDREYALKALKDFGGGTGIIDLYPLEVMKHLLEHVPSFFTRVKTGRFLTSSSGGKYKGETGTPIVLTYDPRLRIRGFALHGGDRPGYLLEPVDPPGTYHLVLDSPGRFKVLLSAISKGGDVSIEEFEVEIVAGRRRLEEEATIQRERSHERADVPRDD
jgi:hypothetical protein